MNGENCDSFLGVFHPHIKKKKVTNKMFLLGLFFRGLLSQCDSSCAEPVFMQARAKALILYKNSADTICYGPFHGYYKNGDYFNNDQFKAVLVKEVWNDDWSIIEKME
ncbi:hypothetical protein [Persicobacter sp. CCB-QB2]|uniref:hypothetical protein n=1 Tax=Persicobacter sp. CCB-QB2 TaxID=1561025 RepID=UPI0006A9792C|nr:hypothetical protein [Persicobacter sp. CCB-QB2]